MPKLFIIKNSKKIHLLLVFPVKGKHGPATLAKSYIKCFNHLLHNKLLLKRFNITIKSHISYKYYANFANRSNGLVWFLFADYFLEINKNQNSLISSNTIYGPMVSPRKWLLFPLNNTYEIYWSNYINRIFAYIVQSQRVKIYLISKSMNIRNIENKYIVSHGCLSDTYSYSVTEWENRYIDILIYAKFADINKEKELLNLLYGLKENYTLKLIYYGNHTKSSLLKDANNSKILIYYSFYDCWPSSLMEMQNMGIYPIVQHCEFIESYGRCINNFNIAIDNFIYIINGILLNKYNSIEISSFYRKRNNCNKVILNTLLDIYNRKMSLKQFLS